jgi:4,4'-diaponeurosporenoate glycosyltransferase
VPWIPSLPSLALYLAGWLCGWLLLWRLPRLARPEAVASTLRAPVAVVVPARDEAAALPAVLGSLVPQLRDSDELVVVDDHSVDATARTAVACGARLVPAPGLPDGWSGKPHACWTGAGATTAPVLVFVDADVTLAPGALDALVAEQAREGGLVSAQPWHDARRPHEKLSVFFNVTALGGGGAFSVLRPWFLPLLAYGPVMVIDRIAYERAGGHAAPSVRRAVAEDIALAGLLGSSTAFAGRAVGSFRMYPDGVRQLVQGWTKNIATGARSVPWWAGAAMVAWIWSLAGAPFTAVACYALSVVQVAVQGRRVGRFGPVVAVAYPALLVFFLAVFLRSVVLTVLARPVPWRGRRVPTR